MITGIVNADREAVIKLKVIGSNGQEQVIDAEELRRLDSDLSSPDENVRWQAAIALGRFSETDPEAIWPQVEKYGSCSDEDTRTAIATCVLEHILEGHFNSFFGRVERLIQERNKCFADTFCQCWQFGEAEEPQNRDRFKYLTVKARKLRS